MSKNKITRLESLKEKRSNLSSFPIGDDQEEINAATRTARYLDKKIKNLTKLLQKK